MSDGDFEAYLALLGRFLRLDARQREDIRRELRAHLEEAVEAEMGRGLTRDEAVVQVLDEFGDAAELAARFSTVGRKRRWIMKGMMTAACLGLGVFLFDAFSPEPPPMAVAGLDANQPALVVTSASDAAGAAKSHAAADVADCAIEAALARTIPEVSIEEVPLVDVIDWFRDLFDVNIHVRWGSLEDAGIERGTPVTVRVRDVSGERALRLVLEEVAEDVRVGYEVDEGVLVIATQERLRQRLETRVYEVNDLLAASPGIVASPADVERAATHYAQAIDRPYRADAERPGEERDQPATQREDRFSRAVRRMYGLRPAPESLLNLIAETIDPDSWATNGGHGTQTVYNGTLVVRQTRDVQRQIERLLADLRDAGAAGLK